MVLGKKKQKSIRGKREERERTQSKYMTHLEKYVIAKPSLCTMLLTLKKYIRG